MEITYDQDRVDSTTNGPLKLVRSTKNFTTIFEKSLLESVMYHMSLVLPPSLIVIGLVLNIVAIVTLKAVPFRKNSVFVIMRAFIWSCIGALIFDTALQWVLIVTNNKYIADYSDQVCRVWSFFINVVSHAPNWLVVAIVIDRYLHVMHSERATTTCNVFVGNVTVIFICIGLGAISVHSLWTYEIAREFKQCGVASKTAEHQIDPNWWILITDTFFYFIPEAFILIFGSAILVQCCAFGCYSIMETRDGSVSNKEALTMAVILGFIYCLLMIPSCAVKIALLQMTSKSRPTPFFYFNEMLSQMAIILTRVVSPVIIFASSPVSRRELMKIIRKLFRLTTDNDNQSTT